MTFNHLWQLGWLNLKTDHCGCRCCGENSCLSFQSLMANSCFRIHDEYADMPIVFEIQLWQLLIAFWLASFVLRCRGNDKSGWWVYKMYQFPSMVVSCQIVLKHLSSFVLEGKSWSHHLSTAASSMLLDPSSSPMSVFSTLVPCQSPRQHTISGKHSTINFNAGGAFSKIVALKVRYRLPQPTHCCSEFWIQMSNILDKRLESIITCITVLPVLSEDAQIGWYIHHQHVSRRGSYPLMEVASTRMLMSVYGHRCTRSAELIS